MWGWSNLFLFIYHIQKPGYPAYGSSLKNRPGPRVTSRRLPRVRPSHMSPSKRIEISKFKFYPLKLIIVIHFIPFSFLYFILRFSHINTYNRILAKILRFNFNKLHHYNRIVDTFEMSIILNIFLSNYFIIYHIYYDYIYYSTLIS